MIDEIAIAKNDYTVSNEGNIIEYKGFSGIGGGASPLGAKSRDSPEATSGENFSLRIKPVDEPVDAFALGAASPLGETKDARDKCIFLIRSLRFVLS
jgi:hypothetical protein